PAEALAVLRAAAERDAASPEAQKLAAALLAEALTGPRGSVLAGQDETLAFVDTLAGRLGVRAPEAYAQLAAALEKAPSQPLKDFAARVVNAKATADAGALQVAVPSLEAAFQEAGVLRRPSFNWELRPAFTRRHLLAIEAAAARAAATPGLKGDDLKTAEDASRVMPVIVRLAVDAGVPAGDQPEVVAGEKVADMLEEGYQAFPGTVFTDQLRKDGLMAAGSGFSVDSDVAKTYSKADVMKLRGWMAALLASGQGWDDSKKPVALTADQKAYLQRSLQSLDRLAAGFDAPRAQPAVRRLHGAAIGLAAPLLASVAGLGLAALLIGGAALAAWYVWKALRAREAGEA
ncbi:MAG: hypothetical protein KGL53_04040, partial [Elusimicrobia bacterium]|nr:hypothetical protein [Elusimicrobiota bacterium]